MPTTRHDWTFNFRHGDIATAAKSKAAYHRERLTFWEAEFAEVDLQVRETTHIRDMPVTGGTRVEFVIDPGLANRRSECTNKIAEHKRFAEEYERHAKILSRDPEGSKALSMGDLEYFDLP